MKRLIILILLILGTIQGKAQYKDSYQLVRNATSIINYAGKKILIDPMFMEKGAMESWAGISRNPTVPLPWSIDSILNKIDLTLITHLHPDHFDNIAQRELSKINKKILFQPFDNNSVQYAQLSQAKTITDSVIIDDITIIRTEAQHGTGIALEKMGKASGFIIKAINNPTIYIVGDAVWTNQIKKNIKKFKPDYIIINSGGAILKNISNSFIIMDDKQAIKLLQNSGNAKVLAVHMEALDHCTKTRKKLRETAIENGFDETKLLIPEDGELIIIE